MSLSSLLTRLSCGYDNYTIFLVAGYCLTSSLLSILNKFAVLHFPYPAALTGFQYALSAFTVIVLSKMGAVEQVNLFDFDMVRQMFPVLLTFYGSVYSNMKVLQHSNVETFIVFRTACPLIVAFADPIFRPSVSSWPSLRTVGSLLLIFAGALGYCLLDSTLSLTSYSWGFLYITIFCTEMIFVKDVVSHIKLSNWGLVYYNNGIGTLMSILVVLVTNEGGLRGASPSPAARSLLVLGSASEPSEPFYALSGIALSCVFGVGISFFGFAVRRKITATGFTVLGCTNKLITMVVNIMVWEHHASLGGQLCLLVCIAGGVLYGELSQRDSEARKAALAAKAAAAGTGMRGSEEGA